MIRSILLPSALCSLLLTGCSGNGTGTDPRGVSGSDEFTTNSLTNYDQVSLGTNGSWAVLAGRLTATGPALQSVLVRKGETFANGYVEAVATRADDGGLVLRFTSESSYYLLAFRDDSAPSPRGELNLAVYRRVGHEFTEIARGDIDWARGTARTIRFEVVGGRLRVFVDGSMVGEVVDPMPLPAGRPGVRHYGQDSTWVTLFDRFSWQELLD